MRDNLDLERRMRLLFIAEIIFNYNIKYMKKHRQLQLTKYNDKAVLSETCSMNSFLLTSERLHQNKGHISLAVTLPFKWLRDHLQ